VSIGVATYPEDARAASALMERADAALYAAKAKGRDRVEVSAGTAQPETGAAG
jgi:diguanylate cyclase (GGDEF)-like protein